MASTPPPPSRIRTPSAPLHGPQYDSPPHHWLRKSSRLSDPAPSNATPSPKTPSSFDSDVPGELKHTPRPRQSRQGISPPSSPIDADDMVATTRAALRKQVREQGLAPSAPQSTAPLGLPTPVKTPRKKSLQPNSGAAARVLFPGQSRDSVDDHLATPSKRNKKMKKQVGFTLEDAEAGKGQIEIYTDGKERVPEVDVSDKNPFYTEPPPTKTTNKRKRSPAVQKQLDRGIEEMSNDHGMLYVFRGRRIFKRFDGPNPALRGNTDGSCSPLAAYGTTEATDLLDDGDDEAEPETHKHFTRSSVRPRRLFNPATPEKVHAGTTTDEEAPTDIEDPESHGLPTAASSRKGKAVIKKITITKVAAKPVDAPPSPFDSWPRRKSRESSGMKREGGTLQSGAKRARESHQ